jgi:hypothetical protein
MAFWLRWRDLTVEPIHHDEVTAYAFTMSIFEYGFPGGQVHPDIPFGYCATSELCYYFHAIAALFFEDPLLVLRVPALLFSMATLALVAYIAWKWFNGYAAFVAAVFYALSPHIIGMADFGRYLSQGTSPTRQCGALDRRMCGSPGRRRFRLSRCISAGKGRACSPWDWPWPCSSTDGGI